MRRACAPKLVALAALTLLSSSLGCVFTPVVLDIGADPAGARVGPLSSLPPRSFALGPFTDSRWTVERIGSKKSGYGDDMADIDSRLPVEQVVRDAVGGTLEKNGHAIAAGAPLRLQGEIDEFWLETRIGLLGGLELRGTVICELSVMDIATGETIYASSYTGQAGDTSWVGYEAGAAVMNAALARFAEALAFDARLVAALRSRPEADPKLGSPSAP